MSKIGWYKACAYNEPQKHLFHREAKKRLKALADVLGLPRGAYDLRRKAGIAVSGEIILHTERLYVQVSQPATSAESGILIRSCQARKDATGAVTIWRRFAASTTFRNSASLPRHN